MNTQLNTRTGIAFATLACIIWSGNFIVARAFINEVPPITLAFFRWGSATLMLLPFVASKFYAERHIITKYKFYFLWTSLFGVSIFNTFLYLAAKTTSAINMALIGTCSSPIFAVFLAAVFLKDRVSLMRIIGMIVMLAGIIFLVVKGSWTSLINFHFTSGDLWVLGAAIFFAGYNVMVRKKPGDVSAIVFLFTTFFIGAIALLPFYLWEAGSHAPVVFTGELVLAIIYLGLGTSILAFLLWNKAIAKLGAARTALFGNLIPLFSSIEAVWLLNESLTTIHLIGGMLIIAGLVIANLKKG